MKQKKCLLLIPVKLEASQLFMKFRLMKDLTSAKERIQWNLFKEGGLESKNKFWREYVQDVEDLKHSSFDTDFEREYDLSSVSDFSSGSGIEVESEWRNDCVANGDLESFETESMEELDLGSEYSQVNESEIFDADEVEPHP